MGFADIFDISQPNKCKLPGCKRGAGVYRIALAVISVIFMYYIFMMGRYQDDQTLLVNDPMNYKLFEIPGVNFCCGGWPLSHMILYFILGLLFPDQDLLIIGGGIIWEIFEDVGFVMVGRKSVPVRNRKTKEVEYSKTWWAGSIQDIVINTISFYIGKIIAKVTGLKICFPWLNGETELCGAQEYCDDDGCIYCRENERVKKT